MPAHRDRFVLTNVQEAGILVQHARFAGLSARRLTAPFSTFRPAASTFGTLRLRLRFQPKTPKNGLDYEFAE
jgi:hypothetical protein